MTPEVFGITRDGATVHRITLTAGDMTASLLTLGSILQDVRLQGRPLTAGSDDLAAYDGGPLAFAGALVGPVANRIGGATCELDGRTLTFEANGAGGHCLHSGAVGLHAKVWQIEEHSQSRVVLSTTAIAGEGGFPGNRAWRATWTLTEERTLTLALAAETDAPTLMNVANHSYWHLGAATGVDGHVLQIAAAGYLPVDDTTLPLGHEAPAAGSRYDFQTGRTLSQDDKLDTCFCLAGSRGPLRFATRLTGSEGTWMELHTTEAGLQAYTADNSSSGAFSGHFGTAYGSRYAIALEAQGWPDAPNQVCFPTVELNPGDTWQQITRWSFGAAE